MLFSLQLIEYKLYYHIIFYSQYIIYLLRNPGLDCIQIHLGHVNLFGKQLTELHLL